MFHSIPVQLGESLWRGVVTLSACEEGGFGEGRPDSIEAYNGFFLRPGNEIQDQAARKANVAVELRWGSLLGGGQLIFKNSGSRMRIPIDPRFARDFPSCDGCARPLTIAAEGRLAVWLSR